MKHLPSLYWMVRARGPLQVHRWSPLSDQHVSRGPEAYPQNHTRYKPCTPLTNSKLILQAQVCNLWKLLNMFQWQIHQFADLILTPELAWSPMQLPSFAKTKDWWREGRWGRALSRDSATWAVSETSWYLLGEIPSWWTAKSSQVMQYPSPCSGSHVHWARKTLNMGNHLGDTSGTCVILLGCDQNGMVNCQQVDVDLHPRSDNFGDKSRHYLLDWTLLDSFVLNELLFQVGSVCLKGA